jgi:hypothetical protein
MNLVTWFCSLFAKKNPLSDDAISDREIRLNEYEKDRPDQSRPRESERERR